MTAHLSALDGPLAAQWQRVRGRLRDEFGEAAYRSWLSSLSLADMAERTGMDRAGISRMENGLTNPTFETIGRYALALDKRVVVDLEDCAPVERVDAESSAMA